MSSSSFNSVFQRKEKKYHLSQDQHQAFLQILAGHMEADEYGTTPISSIYFDTPQHLLIERSLESPLYKEKLRVRAYGAPASDERVFVEIKKKFKGVVYKRRVGMSAAGAKAYLSGMPYKMACQCYPLADSLQQEESISLRGFQIAREIDAFVQRYENLAPSIQVDVQRTAYKPLADSPEEKVELRITFDEDIQFRNLSMAHGASEKLLEAGEVIMEIKCMGPYPFWLVDGLSQLQAYPQAFSKCGEAYKEIIERADAISAQKQEVRRKECSKACSRRSMVALTA